MAVAEDDTLFAEPWNDHLVVVTKNQGYLHLWLMEMAAPDTDWVQSAQDLADPLRLVLTYTQAMMLALAWQPQPRRVYVSGLGGGCLATVLHHYLPTTHIDCVEIAPPVAEAARRFFGFQPDELMQLTIGDAREHLAQAPEAYDALFLDIFTDRGETPAHLTEPGFYALCRERLGPGGLLAMNLGNRSPVYYQSVRALAARFASVYACPGRGSTSVLFAVDQPPIPQITIIERAIGVQRSHGFRFPLAAWTVRIRCLHPREKGVTG